MKFVELLQTLICRSYPRVQREQILARPDTGLDPGPPEAEFSLEQSELRGDTETELQHLRQDKARLEMELQASREEVVWCERVLAALKRIQWIVFGL